ncbi:MAG: hypothetical protein JO223_07385 [Hyphomicrobiales bacterium]|nr:hypothetical protein [Hyphomicrobiales bacterium]MBV8439551.1 hypothetical protein [Hyphomicrobiales bacterium]
MPFGMERRCANTRAFAQWLGKRPEVTKIIHPSYQTGVGKQRA